MLKEEWETLTAGEALDYVVVKYNYSRKAIASMLDCSYRHLTRLVLDKKNSYKLKNKLYAKFIDSAPSIDKLISGLVDSHQELISALLKRNCKLTNISILSIAAAKTSDAVTKLTECIDLIATVNYISNYNVTSISATLYRASIKPKYVELTFSIVNECILVQCDCYTKHDKINSITYTMSDNSIIKISKLIKTFLK